jgi:hypothetical protein
VLKVKFNSHLLRWGNYSDSPFWIWSIATSLEVDLCSTKLRVNQSLAPGCSQCTGQMVTCNQEPGITCAGQRKAAGSLKTASLTLGANRDWKGSMYPFQRFPRRVKVPSVKNTWKGHFRHGLQHAFRCHWRVFTEERAVSHQPFLSHHRKWLQSKKSHVTPSLP